MKDLHTFINFWFPIEAALSSGDKLTILRTLSLVKQKEKQFSFLEIGSWLGGSLAPFARDQACTFIASVDERGRKQPDERGAKFDYTGVTSAMMLDNLAGHGLDTGKIAVFDRSIESVTLDSKFDLAFIDGEHTDVATFRDFVYTFNSLKRNSIVLFHDSSIVSKAIEIVKVYLTFRNHKFRLYKPQVSEITCMFFGDYVEANLDELYGGEDLWDSFLERAEDFRAKNIISNRVEFNLGWELKPPPVLIV
jgi:hypothetical protein